MTRKCSATITDKYIAIVIEQFLKISAEKEISSGTWLEHSEFGTVYSGLYISLKFDHAPTHKL
jgi:hypothetical protein